MSDKEYMDRLNGIISKLAFDPNTLWFLDVIYKLNVKFVDSGIETAGVIIKDFTPYLYINKKFVDGLTDEEYKGLILHEILHLALYHTVRVHDDYNHMQWNAACDLEVNSLINSYKIKLPKGALFPKQFSAQDKLSSEMYYKVLNQNQKQNKNQNQNNNQQQNQGNGQNQQGQGGGKGQGQGQGQQQQQEQQQGQGQQKDKNQQQSKGNGQQDQQQNQNNEQQNQGGGQQGQDQQQQQNQGNSSGGGQGGGQNNNQDVPQTLDDHSGWAQDEATSQMQKQILDKIIKDAITKNKSDLDGTETMEHIAEGHSEANDCDKDESKKELTSGKQHGHGKGSSEYTVESANGGNVKWNHILNRLIRRTLSKSYLPSFKRTSRRYGELVKGHIKNHVVDNIIIAVDTSGSINKTLHKRFMEEIKLIQRMFKIKIRYIQCDDDIQQDIEFKRYTDINQIRIKGGGGTDFRPVFDWIEKNHYNPNAILYFTDGAGDYPEMSKYNTLWVLSDKECLESESYKPPFGNILVLDDKEG